MKRLLILALLVSSFTPVGWAIQVENVQTPWQTHGSGRLGTGFSRHMAMGYHFTPLTDGQVIGLGGFFEGSKTVRLFEKSTGQLLASAIVTSSNAWNYSPISPVKVKKDTTYTIAVYLEGSGGTYRRRVRRHFPKQCDEIRIEGTTMISTLTNPINRPTVTRRLDMFGQVDIQFVPQQSVPSVGTVVINDGAAFTNQLSVTLQFGTVEPSQSFQAVQVSNDGLTYSPSQPYTSTIPWSLTTGDGEKTVFVKFGDGQGKWTAPVKDTITLDTTPPHLSIVSPLDGEVIVPPSGKPSLP